jgi:hypothetical protein
VEQHDEEEKLLRSVAIQNANSILLARQRAEQELVSANEALERKTEELAHSLSMMEARRLWPPTSSMQTSPRCAC